MCEQLGTLKNSVYPRLLTQSLLSPTSSASDLRVYYNKLVRAKEAAPQQIIPALAPPHSRSSSPSSTTPPTTSSPTLTSGEDDSLEEGLSSLLQECLVDIALLLVMSASKDHPNQLEYQKWCLRLAARWDHLKHLFKPSLGLCVDITLCSAGVRLGMRVNDYTSARASAFKFINLMDHPIFMYLPLPPSVVVPLLEYFEELKDANNLAFLFSRLRLLNNASYFNAPSLAPILQRISPLLGYSLPPVHA